MFRIDESMAVERMIPARGEDIFRFLSRLEHHWQLAPDWIEVLSLERPPGAGEDAPFDRGVVRMRGPLGISRTARTQVSTVEPPGAMSGTARVGSGTVARVRWTLVDEGPATRVRLGAELERAGPVDRTLLALGGWTWLEGRFRAALDHLAAVVESGFEDRTAGPPAESMEVTG